MSRLSYKDDKQGKQKHLVHNDASRAMLCIDSLGCYCNMTIDSYFAGKQ